MRSTRAPYIKGLRFDDLIKLLKDSGHANYFPSKTRTGEWPKISGDWLVNVSKLESTNFYFRSIRFATPSSKSNLIIFERPVVKRNGLTYSRSNKVHS